MTKRRHSWVDTAVIGFALVFYSALTLFLLLLLVTAVYFTFGHPR